MSIIIIVLIVLAVVFLAIGVMYNGLVRAKVRTDEAWSDISVQMKRRFDLIPNLVSAVKGYAKHEKTVFAEVTKARAASLGAQSVGQAAQAENQLQAALKSLFAVAEAYPDLKASDNFKQLQEELTDTEDKIQAARRFYNGAVRDLNIKVTSFPTNIFARQLGFTSKEFFEVDEVQSAAVSEPVAVDFSDKKSE